MNDRKSRPWRGQARYVRKQLAAARRSGDVRKIAAVERAIRTPELSHLLAYAPALPRVVAGLPQLHRELFDLQPFRKVLLHGDVHSRNVVLRAKSGTERAVFIDWGRARVGSRREDVSSWLESLGCWEHEVRRRHDTLLRG